MALILIFPSLPRLVLIKTTPLAPFDPYIAVADASFKTVNDSTSSTFISFKSRSKPSTKTNAALLAPKVDILRTQNSDTDPGRPSVCIACMPGTTPANASAIEALGEYFNSSTSTFVIAPVTAIFFCVPIPVTTTSSIILASASFITTFTVRCSFTSTSTLSYPIYENTSL